MKLLSFEFFECRTFGKIGVTHIIMIAKTGIFLWTLITCACTCANERMYTCVCVWCGVVWVW